MNNIIDKILIEISAKYTLKFSNNRPLYKLENIFFCINLKFHDDTISYITILNF
ncbi:hypothetical protein CHRY9293_02503 [Chryseobacterium potabilaquae]|uniref:Uncharacterized protein n=1 Tax=Chryseobacterium potabilaquae TaxID=2675057 RepID=A0A6N4XBM1_9FLAO|nr:hypothetical protein CHRY9293_02503 [Chryseobacterium potabilaquae]